MDISNHLAISGGSAGGLLMGAVINMRSDLFKVVVADVPFVDVVTTILDTSLPLSAMEREEWGDPNDKVYYDCMKSYSPYDNVEAKDYPDMLITAGLNDSRVNTGNQPNDGKITRTEDRQQHSPTQN